MTKDELLLQRRRKGLTQSELATVIGYSRQAIIKWERGAHAIPDDVAARIIEACQENVPSRAETRETAREKRNRQVHEKKMASHWRSVYKALRAWPDIPNHTTAMRFLARQGNTIPPCAYAGIVEDFPDILADPNGNYTMTKEQSFAALSINHTDKGANQ